MSNIYVTQPFLPPLEEFIPMLEEIWKSRVLTNAGPYHQQFEVALASFLSVDNVSLVTNGTVALTLALRSLKLAGEVITTPFSFVATSNELVLAGLTPRFVDIREADYNIDPTLIGNAVGPETSAILAVHCYGNPCDTDAIRSVASAYDLKVIYDAAHAFGVRHNGSSILDAGDVNTVSFHATKAFNTFEGGLVVSASAELKKRIDMLRNFGIISETEVMEVGLNGKMSEFNSAFGLLQLRYFDKVQRRRSERDAIYRECLEGVPGLSFAAALPGVSPNYSYFPVRISEDFAVTRDELYEFLKSKNIYARRYFYPLISDFPAYRKLVSASAENLPVATRVAREVLCLPIYPDLAFEDQMMIIDSILKIARHQPMRRSAALY